MNKRWPICSGIGIFLFLNSILLVNAQDINSHAIGSDGITTVIEKFDPNLDEITKFYEVSDSALRKGHDSNLKEKDAFKLELNGVYYYIFVWNMTEENVGIIFPGQRALSYKVASKSLIDLNEDGNLDIELNLRSIEEDSDGKKANFFLKKVVEKDLIPSGDYFELFDVTVRLADEEIYFASDLEAFIIFENFGEGASEIDISYSIIDEEGLEVYSGADNKIVQTENKVVKEFDFLILPNGKYLLRTEIFYGKNQTGESEQGFKIVDKPFIERSGGPLFFVLTLLLTFFIIVYTRKIYRNKTINKKIVEMEGINPVR